MTAGSAGRTFERTILQPDDARRIEPRLAETPDARIWLYRYEHPRAPWTLSIATHAPPGSQKLSLGGFRIATEERTSLPHFDPDREAIDLAIGMEEKVEWSRLLRIGGPLAKRDFARIVGGKCVLVPTPDARVGQPRDFELLDFATACLADCARSAGIHITTGQDLGHGVMSDGRTASLAYLNRGFPGSVVADTSRPTAEGNYQVLHGMLRAFDIPLAAAVVGQVGIGNIGWYILGRLCEAGTRVLAVESRAERRAEIAARGIRVWSPDSKLEFLRQPLDALVVNASGGSLDPATVRACAANERLAVISGSENLAMPDATGVETLRRARKVFCPTELAGMMGYLTAVEEYLAHLDGLPFKLETLLETARQLEPAAFAATRAVRDRDHAITFEQAIREVSPAD